jgi:hypothetical protein
MGLVTGIVFGGFIHLLLVAAILLFPLLAIAGIVLAIIGGRAT